MTALPMWLRAALYATAVMNVLVGLAFASGSATLLAATGMPAPVPAFYTLTVGMFVALFGIGYFAVARGDEPERLFLALAGSGKLCFVALVFSLFLAGSLPARAALAAAADLPFGLLFVGWVLTTRT